MIKNNMSLTTDTKIVIFDLDGTLAESKSKISNEMADALKALLQKFEVAVISGGNFNQFQNQLISCLNLSLEESRKFYLFPTSGTSFYKNITGAQWEQVYCDNLTIDEVTKILQAFEQVLSTTSVDLPNKIWGNRIENRGTQITFSAMGQLAPPELKKNWDIDFQKRLQLMDELQKIIPEFAIKTGGSTSIDITKNGIDKSFGISQIERYLNFSKNKMLFIGDALFVGGNDYPVFKAGVTCIETNGPDFTLKIINSLIKN